MKVLMNCLSSTSGGAVAYLRNLAFRLSERAAVSERHAIRFLAYESQASLLSGMDESRVRWVAGERPSAYRRILWERRNMTRVVREERADVLFTPYQIGPSVPGARQVLMLRNMEPFLFERYTYSLKTWLRNRLLRRASERQLRRADRVIAVSDFARQRLTSDLGIDPHRVRTIHHGAPKLDPTEWGSSWDRDLVREIGVEGRFVLSVGSLLPYRRTEDLIAAFEEYARHDPDIRLVIAGSGADRRYVHSIEQAVRTSFAADRISVVGQVPWPTVVALYRESAACVIATEIEACPNIALEAMAAGCVVISSDRPPLPEIFGDSSLEYRARDTGDLARQLRRGLRDARLRDDLKARALARATQFSWDRCAESTFSVLTDW